MDWLKSLNPEQREAVLHDRGPMLILAGAGSGKTTVLVSRTGRMLSDKLVQPEEICVLTFTNKAARELKHRVAEKLGPSGKRIWAGTFHSFGLEIIRANYKRLGLPKYFGVIDQTDGKAIIKDLIKNISHFAKSNFDEDKLLNMINDWRTRNQKYAKKDDPYEEAVQILLPKYLNRLSSLGVVDFESLLLLPIKVFEEHEEVLHHYQNKFKQLMVDEFQDTNQLQMKLIKKLVEKHQNITVVGDDDQSIYGWRGACISNILNFPNNYDNCKVVRLERNYRSTPSILNLANSVINKNQARHDKVLKAEAYNDSGHLPELFSYENEEVEIEETINQIRYFQGESYKLSDIAVLFRSNSQGALLEAALRFHQIPYSLTGGTGFFDRKEIRDIMAYLKCAIRPNELAFRRIVNTPSRGIGDITIKTLEEYAKQRGMTLGKAFKFWQDAGVSPKIGKNIDSFFEEVTSLKDYLINGNEGSAGNCLLHFLTRIGYRHMVHLAFKDKNSANNRWRLVETFANVLDSFMVQGGRNEKTLKEFLESMELRDKIDEDSDKEKNEKVQLLTLHASKGLEFPVVFLIGLEEDILPHKLLGQDVSEERRLFYVGVTRAKERLVLSYATQRKKYGRWQPSSPSRFIIEAPEDSMSRLSGGRPVSEETRQDMMAALMSKLDKKIENSSKI